MNTSNDTTQKVMEAIKHKFNTRRLISMYTGLTSKELAKVLYDMESCGLIRTHGYKQDTKASKKVRVYIIRNKSKLEQPKPPEPPKTPEPPKPPKPKEAAPLDKVRQIIFDLACKRPVTMSDICKELPDVSRRTITLLLLNMARREELTRMDRRGGQYVYHRTGIAKAADVMLEFMRKAVRKALKRRKGDVSKYGYAFAY